MFAPLERFAPGFRSNTLPFKCQALAVQWHSTN